MSIKTNSDLIAAAIEKTNQLQDALREIAAGNLDGETMEQFAERCVKTAKEVLK